MEDCELGRRPEKKGRSETLRPTRGILLFFDSYYENDPAMIKAVSEHLKKQSDNGSLKDQRAYEEYLKKHTPERTEPLQLYFNSASGN